MTPNEFVAYARHILYVDRISTKDLAARLGLTYSYLTRIMAGKMEAGIEYRLKLKEHLQQRKWMDGDGVVVLPGLDNMPALTPLSAPSHNMAAEPAPVYGRPQHTPQPVMRPGGKMQIVTTITLENDIVSEHSISVKPIN